MRILLLLLVLPQVAVSQLNQDFWTPVVSAPVAMGTAYYSIAVNEQNTIYLGTNLGLYKSTDQSQTWQATNAPALPFYHIAVSGEHLYAVTSEGVIYTSPNGGEYWDSSQLPDVSEVTDIQILDNGHILVTTGYIEEVEATGYFRGQGTFKSTDEGHTWHKVNMGLQNDHYIAHLAMDSKGRVYASAIEYDTRDGAILYSTDRGDTWQVFPDISFNWAYDVAESDPATTKIVQVTSLEVDPSDSLHVSLLGATGNAATSVNLSNSFEGARSGDEWKHMNLVTFGYPWHYLEAHSAFYARNGDVYANRLGNSLNLSGIFYSREGAAFEKKHINPLWIGGAPFFNYCVFAEQSNGRVYVLQQQDNVLYYSDSHLISPVLSTNDEPVIKVYPNPATEVLHILPDDPSLPVGVAFYSLDGKRIFEGEFGARKLIRVPLHAIPRGLYLVAVVQVGYTRSYKVAVE